MSEFKEISFESTKGNTMIYARKCVPEGEPKGVVQISHGIAEHIGRYEELMTFFAEHGFVAVGHDHLGHGKTTPAESAERGIFDEKDGWKYAVDDMKKLYDTVHEEYPCIPYIFFGHSMGSFLTRTLLIRYPECADLAILSGTGHQTGVTAAAGYGIAETAVKLYGASRPANMLNDMIFGSYNDSYDEVRTPNDWISSVPEEVDKYIADPDCGFIPSVSMMRDMLGGVMYDTDPSNLVRMNKETPVLFISGWADPVGEYGKGVKRAFKAFCSAGMKYVHIKLYPGGRHELIHEANRDEVMNDMLNWINDKLAKIAEGRNAAPEAVSETDEPEKTDTVSEADSEDIAD